MSLNPREHEVSVKGLCQDEEGRILVLREGKGTWELPGGGLEPGESLTDCLKRECLEEIGVECEFVSSDPYKAWVGSRSTGGTRLIILYKIKLKSFDFKKTTEAEEVKFITKEELAGLNLVTQLEPLKSML